MKFKSKVLRNTLRKACHNSIEFSCTLCDYVGKSKHLLKSHNKNKHDKEGLYQCKFCPIVKSKMKDLTIHIRDYHDSHNRYKYVCSQCDRKFTKMYHLKNHVKVIHEGIRFPCDQCEYKAREPSNLRHHKLRHHDEDKYPCSECDYWGNKVKLQYHMRNMHKA